METKRPRSVVSVATIHFAGIKLARPAKAAAGRPASAATPKPRREKRVSFAGIGGGGYAQPAATAADPAPARIARQRRIDALWDSASAAAGIMKPSRP